jgi:hypothetical protein
MQKPMLLMGDSKMLWPLLAADRADNGNLAFRGLFNTKIFRQRHLTGPRQVINQVAHFLIA